MALTATQRLAIKKHLGEAPNSTDLNAFIGTLEDGAEMEAELVASITACDSALAAYYTATGDADELVEGAGAKFSYERRMAIKQQAYRNQVINLARLLSYPIAGGGTVGFLTV